MSGDSHKEREPDRPGGGTKGKGDSRSGLAEYAPYLSLGAEIAAGITVPILAGWWLDGWLDTSPWLLLAGCVVGIVNIFVLIFQLNSRLNES